MLVWTKVSDRMERRGREEEGKGRERIREGGKEKEEGGEVGREKGKGGGKGRGRREGEGEEGRRGGKVLGSLIKDWLVIKGSSDLLACEFHFQSTS